MNKNFNYKFLKMLFLEYDHEEEEVYEEKSEIAKNRSLSYEEHKEKLNKAKMERKKRQKLKRKLPGKFNKCNQILAKRRKILNSG